MVSFTLQCLTVNLVCDFPCTLQEWQTADHDSKHWGSCPFCRSARPFFSRLRGGVRKQTELRGRLWAPREGQNENKRWGERKKEKVLKNMPTRGRESETEIKTQRAKIRWDICSWPLQVIREGLVSSRFPCQDDSAKPAGIYEQRHRRIHLQLSRDLRFLPKSWTWKKEKQKKEEPFVNFALMQCSARLCASLFPAHLYVFRHPDTL